MLRKISLAVFASFLAISELYGQQFEDITEGVGIIVNSFGFDGAGGACVDLDQDGWQDLIFTTTGDSLVIYRNLGDFQFELLPVLHDVPGVLMVTTVDFDRDGDRDILATAWGGQDHLFEQTDPLVFEDVTPATGLSLEMQEHHNHMWFDANKDGWLDLYTGGPEDSSR